MAPDLPDAGIRTQVRVPLRLPDGYATTTVVTADSATPSPDRAWALASVQAQS
jgi:hypothetical protein